MGGFSKLGAFVDDILGDGVAVLGWVVGAEDVVDDAVVRALAELLTPWDLEGTTLLLGRAEADSVLSGEA